MVLAAIPSPSRGVLHLGPVPLRAYALMMLLGIAVAIVVTARRLRARGADPALAGDVAVWAVPFGIIGARIYHVVSSPDGYFGEGGDLLGVFRIWEGGLSIWGAVAGGAVGAWIGCRRAELSFGLFADAFAPGLALAQAIARWGNWFNQELFGRATDLPWAVRIDPEHQAIPGVSTYHPTFLYESLWNLGVAAALLQVDRRRRLPRGKLFLLYMALYTVGRLWIEALRIDPAEHVLGLRVNIWVSILVFVLAVVALLVTRGRIDPDVVPGTAGGTPGGTVGDGAAEDGDDLVTTRAGDRDGGEREGTHAGKGPVAVGSPTAAVGSVGGAELADEPVPAAERGDDARRA